jgi:hypothetical protein
MRAEGGGGYGTRKMINAPDQMTTVFKVRAYLPYLNKILNEIEIVMPAATSDVLKFIVSDLGNTGFSDDSGADFAREASDFLVIFGVPPAFKLGLRRVYLSLEGNDNNDCLSLQTKCKSLKRAMEVSQTGDEVIVSAGIYAGHLNINITIPPARFFIVGPALDALSALKDDSQYAIFDCEGYSSAFSFFKMDSSPIFQNLVFRNCREESGNGGAIKITDSSPAFVDCSFQRCSAATGTGGAVSIEGSKSNPLFSRCSFDANFAMLGGGEGCPYSAVGCLLMLISALSMNSGKVQIMASIFLGNFADVHGGAVFVSEGAALIRSTTFAMVRMRWRMTALSSVSPFFSTRTVLIPMEGLLQLLPGALKYNQVTLPPTLLQTVFRPFTTAEEQFCI